MDRELTVTRGTDGGLLVRLAGRFRIDAGLASIEPLHRALVVAPLPMSVRFDASDLREWDSSLIAVLDRVVAECRQRKIEVDPSALPPGARRLLGLVESAPVVGREMRRAHLTLIERVGCVALRDAWIGEQLFELIGRVFFSFGRLLRGRARVRTQDALDELNAAGIEALPIVGVVSLLVGMILAFVGWVTLQKFGAAIYVANVVAIGMVRELAAIVTAIVMAGRSGSAYAAELGTMNVTEETHALITMGIDPIEFLVLPRMLALAIAMPVLYLFANVVALIGGGLVATVLLKTNLMLYVVQSQDAVPSSTVFLGLGKSMVFGLLVGLAGCAEGMRAEQSAAAVGRAATRAVVLGIVWIIAADGFFAVLFYALGL